ncbi:MAG: alpha-hydroxy-acid oxidizing protein [Acidobacteria bacterium]|nr:alpha-hydroxy-acid oxidizing protein [Acidobacteriota bacterium]
MSNLKVSRREALGSVAGLIAGPGLSGVEGPGLSAVEGPGLSGVEGPGLSAVEGPSLARGQVAKGTPPPRRPPRDELVNALEFEDVAKLMLPAAVYSTIAGSDRAAFDRITFRPRMLVPTLDLDLSVDLFGEKHLAPILVGPVAEQRQYHAEGELATVRGASAAKTGVIVSSRSSVPIAEIAAQAKTPLWYSVYAADASARKQVDQAIAAGCKVVCVTVGASLDAGRATSKVPADWKAVDRIRQGLDLPIVIKGVMTPEDANAAIAQGARGIVVSNHGGVVAGRAPLEVLASIVDLVGAKITVLVDGSFRRGTDILKALVFGAQAVLLARPVMWGLAAYGAEGVQSVIELLQTTLGRNFGMIGAPNLKSLNRAMVKVHAERKT